jgi:hypothetical protein
MADRVSSVPVAAAIGQEVSLREKRNQHDRYCGADPPSPTNSSRFDFGFHQQITQITQIKA